MKDTLTFRDYFGVISNEVSNMSYDLLNNLPQQFTDEQKKKITYLIRLYLTKIEEETFFGLQDLSLNTFLQEGSDRYEDEATTFFELIFPFIGIFNLYILCTGEEPIGTENQEFCLVFIDMVKNEFSPGFKIVRNKQLKKDTITYGEFLSFLLLNEDNFLSLGNYDSDTMNYLYKSISEEDEKAILELEKPGLTYSFDYED